MIDCLKKIFVVRHLTMKYDDLSCFVSDFVFARVIQFHRSRARRDFLNSQ